MHGKVLTGNAKGFDFFHMYTSITGHYFVSNKGFEYAQIDDYIQNLAKCTLG